MEKIKYFCLFQQISNQENVKNVGKSATITVNSKRAALGELSNKVTVRTKDASGVFKLPAAKKLLEKGQSSSLEDDKKPVQKPVLKLVVSNSQKLEAEATASLSQIKLEKEPESFSSDLLPVEDIDQEDNDNPILVSVYTNEIYNYMRKLEQDFPVKENYLQGQQITYKMRSVLIDWLVEVHQQFRLLQETLYLTVAIIDRFLQVTIFFLFVRLWSELHLIVNFVFYISVVQNHRPKEASVGRSHSNVHS